MKVYKYGARRPQQDAQLREMLWLAHCYQNDLIAIARARRERLLAITRDRCSPDFAGDEQITTERNKRIKEVRKRLREELITRQLDAYGSRDKDMAPRQRNKLIREAVKAIRDENPTERDVRLSATAAVYAAMRADRRRQFARESGKAWGTYQLIEQRIDAALASDGELRFKRWDKTGSLGATIQGSDNKTTSCAPHFEIVGDGKCRIARVRISAGLTIDLPIKYHRPLPEGKLYRAAIHVARIGTRFVYSLTCTVDGDSMTVAPHREGRIAVNLGWHVRNDCVLIATATDDTGKVWECTLPRKIDAQLKHAEGLRSLADKLCVERFGDAKMRRKMRELGCRCDRVDHPDRNATFEMWARQDRHLYQWERDEYNHMMRARDEIYSLFSFALAKQYDELVIEDWSLAYMALKSTAYDVPAARHYRFLVAPSRLRAALKARFSKVTEVSGPLTVQCFRCKRISATVKDTKAKERIVVCEHCGTVFDQDIGNTRNQLDSAAA